MNDTNFTLEDAPQGASNGTEKIAETPKRRGRPRRAPLEETTVTADGQPQTAKKPRRKNKRKASAEDIKEAAEQMYALHWFAARATGLPELEITQEEAEKLGKATAALSAEFGYVVTGRAAVIFQFVTAAAFIYVPRAIKIKARIDDVKRKTPVTVDESGAKV